MEHVIRKYVRAVISHTSFFIIGTVVLFVISVLIASKLDVDSSVDNLLPEDNALIATSTEIENEFGGQDDFIIAVEGEPEKAKRFMDELADDLLKEDLALNLFYKVNNTELESFAHLYVDTELYEGIEKELDEKGSALSYFLKQPGIDTMSHLFTERINTFPEQEQKELVDTYASMFLPGQTDITAEQSEHFMFSLLFGHIEQLNEAEQEELVQYMISDSGTMFLMQIRPHISLDNFNVERDIYFPKLYAKIDELKDSEPYKGIEVGVTGGYLVQDYEADAVAMDSFLSTAVATFVIIMLMIVFAFRRIVVPLSTGIPLLLGVLLTAAFAVLVYKDINMFSIAFAALLLGMGIDYAIHILTRYYEERSKGNSLEDALVITLHRTGGGMIAGSLTTACVFIAFLMADMKAFTQMGVISGVGIILALLSMLTIVPCILVIADRRQRKKGVKDVSFTFLRPVGKVASRSGWLVIIGVAALAVVAWSTVMNTTLKTDFTAMYPDNIPSIGWLDRVQQEFDYDGDTINLVAEDFDQLETWVEQLNEFDSVQLVESIIDYLPTDQAYKISVIDKIQATQQSREVSVAPEEKEQYSLEEMQSAYLHMLTTEWDHVIESVRDAGINEQTTLLADLQQQSEHIQAGDMVLLTNVIEHTTAHTSSFDNVSMFENKTMTISDLPDSLVSNYIGINGKYLVTVSPNGDIWDEKVIESFQEDVTPITNKMTGMPLLLVEIITLIKQDVLKVSVISIFIIFVILFIAFRSVKLVILTMIPVVVALYLTLGLRPLFKFDLNMLNMMGLPLIIGIGVGNAVHITQRIRTSKGEDIQDIVVHTGKAVLMSILTTLVGFGSLMFANHPGMEELGKLIVLGLGTCLVLIIILLPALFSMFHKQKKQYKNSGREQ